MADRATAEAAAAAGRVLLSEPFETAKSTNLEATIWAPTQNTWIGVGTDLISETTGEARSFYLLSDRYSGVDGGESWSEGSQSRSVYVSQVPPGKYVLRLEPESDAGKAPASFRVRLPERRPAPLAARRHARPPDAGPDLARLLEDGVRGTALVGKRFHVGGHGAGRRRRQRQ